MRLFFDHILDTLTEVAFTQSFVLSLKLVRVSSFLNIAYSSAWKISVSRKNFRMRNKYFFENQRGSRIHNFHVFAALVLG